MFEERSKIEAEASKGRFWLENNFSQVFNDSYEGACAIASTYVMKRLHQLGVKAYVAISDLSDIGGQHAFVTTKKFIVDITATQFQNHVDKFLPPIIVIERHKAKEFFWRNVMARLHTLESVVDFTSEPKWPDEQIPNLEYIEETYEDF